MYYRLLLFCGFIIFIIPFLGVPFVWKQWVQFAVGLAVMMIAFIGYVHSREDEEEESYVEGGPDIKNSDLVNDFQNTSVLENNTEIKN